MPDLATINGYVRALTSRFRDAAKGLDGGCARFLKARPAERILAGFLTPVDPQAIAAWGNAVAGGQPDVPSDDSYEQTHVGFEWSLPSTAVGRGLTLHVACKLHVFARVIPAFREAAENARLRNGSAQLIEVWQRFNLTPGDASLAADIDVDRLARNGAAVVSLQGQSAQAWSSLAPADLHVWRTEQTLGGADIADEQSYSRWLSSLPRPNRPQELEWKPEVDVRVFVSPNEPHALRLLLRFINRSSPVDKQQSAFVDPRLYAVEMAVTLPTEAHSFSEFRSLEESYRYDRRIAAVGINCQPDYSIDAQSACIRAETVPLTETPRLMPREIEGGVPDFESLADPVRAVTRLRAIYDAMLTYDEDVWAAKVASLSDQREVREAQASRDAFVGESAAFSEGIRYLELDPAGAAARAFHLMNAAMLRVGRLRRRPVTKWHLFQIVFIVSQLPQLIRAAAGDRTERPLNILWFPAGGGKTEAFMGLLLWHAFFDRLRGKLFGVTAFLRYPLRLLTYQQLQRVAAVLGQAEEVRLSEAIPGQPFSLGYYVGQSTTPNSIDDFQHTQLTRSGVPADWQRVFRCPSCAIKDVRLRYEASLRLVEHYCGNRDCRTRGSRLPVYIVDDDLYRYVPTVIVSTVDKLAQLGQNRRFAQLFGRIQFYCPTHGAAYMGSNEKLCPASREAKARQFTGRCGTETVQPGPFTMLGPSLHVQDEMHLMREGLATFDSHYETTALTLQQDVSNHQGWALIGATATITGYREQAAHLYLKDANRFPAPGPAAYESFYYTTDSARLGRLFIGVLGVGRTHTPSVARTLSLLYGVIEQSRKLANTDIDAARTFLNLPTACAEDIEEMAFHYEVVLSYVLTRKGGDQVSEAVDVRVRSEVEEYTGQPLRVETFNGNVEMPQMIGVMEEIESAVPTQPLGDRVRGVVATNVISHGVDVDRFNVMVFAGLPRQFAEYIQASARVGRQLPGISVLVVTPQSERDRSVFDRFDKCHQYVDRLVEPVPVNRWSEPALQLTVPGVIAAYLMGYAPTVFGEEIYLVRHVKTRFGTRGADILSQQRVVEWVKRAMGADSALAPPGFEEVVENLSSRIYGMVTGASRDSDNETLSKHLNAMRSLRDIDDPAWISVYKDSDKELIRTLGM